MNIYWINEILKIPYLNTLFLLSIENEKSPIKEYKYGYTSIEKLIQYLNEKNIKELIPEKTKPNTRHTRYFLYNLWNKEDRWHNVINKIRSKLMKHDFSVNHEFRFKLPTPDSNTITVLIEHQELEYNLFNMKYLTRDPVSSSIIYYFYQNFTKYIYLFNNEFISEAKGINNYHDYIYKKFQYAYPITRKQNSLSYFSEKKLFVNLEESLKFSRTYLKKKYNDFDCDGIYIKKELLPSNFNKFKKKSNLENHCYVFWTDIYKKLEKDLHIDWTIIRKKDNIFPSYVTRGTTLDYKRYLEIYPNILKEYEECKKQQKYYKKLFEPHAPFLMEKIETNILKIILDPK